MFLWKHTITRSVAFLQSLLSIMRQIKLNAYNGFKHEAKPRLSEVR